MAKTRSAPSLILAMHARYEQAWQEFNTIDGASLEFAGKTDPDSLCEHHKLDRAGKANAREFDALRLAILWQVPDTWPEALVLSYHIHCAHDLEDSPSKESKAALAAAIDTLFDFMACEVEQDHEALGEQFKNGTMLVFEQRRLRTGVVED